MTAQANDVAAEVGRILGARLIGTYLYGSAVDGGLRPDSDLDLLVLVGEKLDASSRRDLIAEMLALSGPPLRPMELTVVSVDEVVPWRYPPRLELQYGEWLRQDAISGDPLGPRESPDLTVLLSQVRERSVPLFGPPVATVLDRVPPTDLRRAMTESLPSLLDDLVGDERNVILTLARMWVTMETGEIVPKDVAVDRVLAGAGIGDGASRALTLARDAYRGEVVDDWAGLESEIDEFVETARSAIMDGSPGSG